MTKDEIEARCRDIVARRIRNVDRAKIVADADLMELGADSLDAMDITLDCEEAFNLHIADEDAEDLRTFGAIVEYLAGKLGASDAAAA